ncbi:MAG: S8 family serine peptidase [Chloroflexota bacterium]
MLLCLRASQATSASAPLAPNLKIIGVEEAWAHGITGQGIVVALLDSGVDMAHPELAARWRGGSNSWFDPYGEHPEGPVDFNGHGTQMLGVILGGDESGESIGIAPDAQWIAARVFDDRGRATTEAIHQALKWVLDPDGDPATDDTPHVLNNSWSAIGTLCNPEFDGDLRALRAAGILPVFAAGAGGPVSPADSPEAFAVGALAVDGESVYFDSAFGPSICGGQEAIYPQVSAPGEAILTTDLFGLYSTLDGTSLAAAHASGALALMLSARPSLTADEQETVLQETAVDLGQPGPDNEFGYGRINIAAAVDSASAPDPTLLMIVVLAAMLIGVAAWQQRK